MRLAYLFFKRMKSSRAGFSLVELMVGVGLIGLVSLVMGQYAISFLKQRTSLISFIDKSNIGSFGSRIISIAENSEISELFIDLPVSSSCSTATPIPCLQTIEDPSGKLTPYSGGGSAHIEFYRDNLSTWYKQPGATNSLSTNFDAGVMMNNPLQGNVNGLMNTVSVTWPLVDENSTEFPMMSRSRSGYAFKFVNSTATSAAGAVPCTSADYALTSVERGLATSVNLSQYLSQLQGAPVVVYNPYMPQQYIVRYIYDIQSCENSNPRCRLACGVSASTVISTNNFIIRLGEIDDAQVARFAPGLKSYMATNAGSTLWSFIFPTTLTTIVASSSASASDLSTFAMQSWAHFYDANSMSPYNLFILPVQVSVYFFRKTSTDGIYSLKRRDFVGAPTKDNATSRMIDVQEIASVNGSVLFSRKLGSKTLRVSIYGGAE